MKHILYLALLSCSIAIGQQTVVKKDGAKLSVSGFELYPVKKRIAFKANGKEQMIAYADLDSAVIDKKVLKRFDIGKKTRLFYVLARMSGRTLGVITSKRNRDRGGFSSVVTLYEVVVIENGKILEDLSFTESKTESESKKREAFFKLVADYFPDCTPLRNKLDLFRSESDTTNSIVLNILDNPELTICK